jgi:HTH-type transcriptional regulator/antitoxin HigA
MAKDTNKRILLQYLEKYFVIWNIVPKFASIFKRMRIITFAKIREFIPSHPDSETALRDWFTKTKHSDWNNLPDIKHTFNSVDYVGNDNYVFNIKGNDYRLVSRIIFVVKKVYIRFIGTHDEYDKIDCSKV